MMTMMAVVFVDLASYSHRNGQQLIRCMSSQQLILIELYAASVCLEATEVIGKIVVKPLLGTVPRTSRCTNCERNLKI